jgi:hypothetical protein
MSTLSQRIECLQKATYEFMYENQRKSDLKKTSDALLYFPILATCQTHHDIHLASVILDNCVNYEVPHYIRIILQMFPCIIFKVSTFFCGNLLSPGPA